MRPTQKILSAKSSDMPEEHFWLEWLVCRGFHSRSGLFSQNHLAISGVAAGVGFGRTLATARKTDPSFFQKGMTGSIEMPIGETGANLAMRALGYGTLLAIFGTGSLMFAVWKLSGAKDVRIIQESREKDQ